MAKRKKEVKEKQEEKPQNKNSPVNPTLMLATDREIALDFATKVYKKFETMIKAIVLFGSSAKKVSLPSSDIDIIIIIDDVSIRWDMELVAYYREELGKLITANPYKKSLHINTVKLSTWWDDLLRGDPILINVIRYGDPLIDVGGFFSPLKVLLQEGKIRPTPEAVYSLLNRAPTHLMRAKWMLFNIVEALYWCCVDSAHAALISADEEPASPEHIYDLLVEKFVKRGFIKSKIADYYKELFEMYKGISHGVIKEIKSGVIDDFFYKADVFLGEMARLVDEIVEKRKD
ncbi:MAG: nucleotidyltransferase domain-containing protein [Candidatus Pacearchaeota archaeon]